MRVGIVANAFALLTSVKRAVIKHETVFNPFPNTKMTVESMMRNGVILHQRRLFTHAKF